MNKGTYESVLLFLIFVLFPFSASSEEVNWSYFHSMKNGQAIIDDSVETCASVFSFLSAEGQQVPSLALKMNDKVIVTYNSDDEIVSIQIYQRYDNHVTPTSPEAAQESNTVIKKDGGLHMDNGVWKN